MGLALEFGSELLGGVSDVSGEDVWETELHTLVEECSLGHGTKLGSEVVEDMNVEIFYWPLL